jgi:hypothetical protein
MQILGEEYGLKTRTGKYATKKFLLAQAVEDTLYVAFRGTHLYVGPAPASSVPQLAYSLVEAWRGIVDLGDDVASLVLKRVHGFGCASTCSYALVPSSGVICVLHSHRAELLCVHGILQRIREHKAGFD